MWAVLALSAVESMFNRWIDLDAATRLQLNQLQGKLLRVVIDSPQLSVDVLFDQNAVRLSPTVLGMNDHKPSIFEQRPYDPAYSIYSATTTLSVSNLVELAKLLQAETGGTGNIRLQGDLSLLQQLQRILAQASPDLAAQLSPWIGAVPAGQIRDIIQQGKQNVSRILSSSTAHAAEILSEDSQLLAARWQMEQFKRGSRELRQDIERLQAKLKQLQGSVARKEASSSAAPSADLTRQIQEQQQQ